MESPKPYHNSGPRGRQGSVTRRKVPNIRTDFHLSPRGNLTHQNRSNHSTIELEKENASLQGHFEKEMNERAKAHKKVAVLLLSWEKQAEDNLDCSEEVGQP